MTLDDCDELFAKFLELQSHSVRISILTELLSACHVLNVTLGRGSTFFWRGRKCTPEGYELQSDLWHPPAHITKPGRLNKAGAPVLYLSTNEETALAEVRAENGDYVHLIAYKLYPGKTLTINCIGEVEHLTRMGYLRVFGVDPQGSLLRMIHREPYQKARTWAYIDAFLARVLADPTARDSNYELTQLISELSYTKSVARAMFYPSARSDIGLNLGVQADAAIAFHPMISFVVRVGKVRRFNFHDVTVVRQVRNIVDGRMQWEIGSDLERQIVFNATKAEFEAARREDPHLKGGLDAES